ncbi:uncharacterized protein N7458_002589 [Penicillium daleae]|uniref:Uncharacterized protein n=1 Tax=Penicillium daleae TaxID=63821 RepID=A0AAD6CDB9_9EURO|nr:uncharacterized protein N7458_002589 [Penicillium daleae]KAJ5461037.1 hypothetical protein N7458_002589 [Penicillium daleae]
MPKKRNKKAQKANKSARDIQTPVSDRENNVDSERAIPKQRTDPEAESSRNKIGKKADVRTRFARSPTREGDFAPNASDYDSDDRTDLESNDASDQDRPTEQQPDPLSSWVKDVIRRETSKESERMVEEFFTAQEPAYENCEAFFHRLNQLIRGANERNDVTDIDVGTIPATGYNGLCQTWQQAANKAVADHSSDEFWSAFNQTRDLLKLFNKRHHLPRTWNISQEWAEQMIGVSNPRAENDSESTSDDGQSALTDQPATSERLSVGSDIDSDDNDQTGLDALEARTMKQQRRLTSAKVLYWWPKGTGSQIFVRYGDRTTPIYRIRAGSHESYSPHTVERVLTTKTRGNVKITGTKNGLPEEFWKYKRKDVENILGVGWKIEDDDEEGLNPLNLLQPAKGASYPHTRALVKWRDGVITLEGRSFIRRISTGSALDGDRVIYQKAEELETAYRERHGLEDLVDDHYDDEDSDIGVSHGRRYRSEPARYSRSVRAKTRNHFRYDSSEDSDSESDAAAQPHNSRYTRHRSEPDRRPMRRTGKAKSKTEKDDALIKKLEREIQRLKVGRSKSPEERRRSHGRERTI